MSEKELPSNTYENVLTDISKKGRVYHISKTYPAYLMLLLFIGLSFLIFKTVNDKVNDEKQAQFDKAIKSVESRIQSLSERKTEFLHSMKGIYNILPQVVKDYFELYGTVPTQTYPSILSITYVPRVKDQDLSTFVFNTKSQGYYSYEVHPKFESQIHYPVELIVPLIGNGHISGLDYASNDIVRKAIENSCDKNDDIATDFFNIRTDTLGFYIIAPVYVKNSPRASVQQRKANFQGALLLEIDAKAFFEKALSTSNYMQDSLAFASDATVAFQILDVASNNTQKIIYKSKNADLFNQSYKPDLLTINPFRIANKTINLKFQTVPDFGGKFQSYLPIISLIISIVLSFAFFGFLLSVITSKAKAIDLAERMTRSQRRIVDSSKDVIAVMDMNGDWKSMNPASKEVFGFLPEEMIGKNIRELLPTGIDKFEAVISSTANEETERLVLQMSNSRGGIKWVSWSFTISRTDGLVYSIGRDMTLEKIAEEQALLRSKQIQLAEQYAHEASQSKTLFMIKLSHQLRNSLTGIIGYLQLLTEKIYDTDEEHDSFVELAEQSSEELFTFVSDIVDATIQTDEGNSVDTKTLVLDKIITNAEFVINSDPDYQRKIKVEMFEGVEGIGVIADSKILSETLADIFAALSEGRNNSDIQISAESNPFEGACDIQIMGPGNELTENMFKIYKDNYASLVDTLKLDKDDVILRLARAASNIRRMSGDISIESFGGDEGNLVMISLPATRKAVMV